MPEGDALHPITDLLEGLGSGMRIPYVALTNSINLVENSRISSFWRGSAGGRLLEGILRRFNDGGGAAAATDRWSVLGRGGENFFEKKKDARRAKSWLVPNGHVLICSLEYRAVSATGQHGGSVESRGRRTTTSTTSTQREPNKSCVGITQEDKLLAGRAASTTFAQRPRDPPSNQSHAYSQREQDFSRATPAAESTTSGEQHLAHDGAAPPERVLAPLAHTGIPQDHPGVFHTVSSVSELYREEPSCSPDETTYRVDADDHQQVLFRVSQADVVRIVPRFLVELVYGGQETEEQNSVDGGDRVLGGETTSIQQGLDSDPATESMTDSSSDQLGTNDHDVQDVRQQVLFPPACSGPQHAPSGRFDPVCKFFVGKKCGSSGEARHGGSRAARTSILRDAPSRKMAVELRDGNMVQLPRLQFVGTGGFPTSSLDVGGCSLAQPCGGFAVDVDVWLRWVYMVERNFFEKRQDAEMPRRLLEKSEVSKFRNTKLLDLFPIGGGDTSSGSAAGGTDQSGSSRLRKNAVVLSGGYLTQEKLRSVISSTRISKALEPNWSSNLLVLDLHGQQLRRLDEVDLPQLRSLNLAFNCFESFAHLGPFPRLQTLDLSHNLLQRVLFPKSGNREASGGAVLADCAPIASLTTGGARQRSGSFHRDNRDEDLVAEILGRKIFPPKKNVPTCLEGGSKTGSTTPPSLPARVEQDSSCHGGSTNSPLLEDVGARSRFPILECLDLRWNSILAREELLNLCWNGNIIAHSKLRALFLHGNPVCNALSCSSSSDQFRTAPLQAVVGYDPKNRDCCGKNYSSRLDFPFDDNVAAFGADLRRLLLNHLYLPQILTDFADAFERNTIQYGNLPIILLSGARIGWCSARTRVALQYGLSHIFTPPHITHIFFVNENAYPINIVEV